MLPCGAEFTLQVGGEAAGVAELVCGALFSLYLNMSLLLSFSLSCSSRSSYSLLCSLDTLHFSLYLVSCLSYSLHQLLNAHAATWATNGLNEMIPHRSITPSGDGAAESDGAGLSGSNADEGEKAQGQEEKQQRGFSVVEKKTLSAMYVRTLLLFACFCFPHTRVHLGAAEKHRADARCPGIYSFSTHNCIRLSKQQLRHFQKFSCVLSTRSHIQICNDVSII